MIEPCRMVGFLFYCLLNSETAISPFLMAIALHNAYFIRLYPFT